MTALRPDHARQVPVDGLVRGCSTLSHPQYASAFQVSIANAAPSAEQWARHIFQGAPSALRSLLVLGWKVGLGLRLGPAGAPGHVLGWTLEATSPQSVTLGARSWALSAQKVVRVDGHRLRVATFVRFEHPAARPLWSAVLPVHRRLEPLLLTKAAARPLP